MLVSTIITVLVGATLWWAYAAIDCGITKTYVSVSGETSAEVAGQLLAIVPIVAANPTDRAAVLAAASSAAKNAVPSEKGRYTWVGQLGFRFGADGRLLHVTTDPSASDT